MGALGQHASGEQVDGEVARRVGLLQHGGAQIRPEGVERGFQFGSVDALAVIVRHIVVSGGGGGSGGQGQQGTAGDKQALELQQTHDFAP
ncbi:hypothetical protein [Thauera humireducens]|uniref:hypothetical protein n=1 Tax=Thauera humireducens TaxID=1134435 RepID=UPI00311F5E5D